MASWMVHLRIADQLLDCLPGLSAVDFVVGNIAPDAFDNRRQYITAFYLEENGHLDREYPYLSEAQMDRFVSDASAGILSRLRSEYGIWQKATTIARVNIM